MFVIFGFCNDSLNNIRSMGLMLTIRHSSIPRCDSQCLFSSVWLRTEQPLGSQNCSQIRAWHRTITYFRSRSAAISQIAANSLKFQMNRCIYMIFKEKSSASSPVYHAIARNQWYDLSTIAEIQLTIGQRPLSLWLIQSEAAHSLSAVSPCICMKSANLAQWNGLL